jgi:hypothetical protein
MTKISKWKVPPTGAQLRGSSLLDGLTALGARLCSLLRTSQAHCSFLCDALNRASPDAKRLGHLQDTQARGRAEPGYLAAGEEAARERYFTWDEPKAARELSRAALEMNCRVSPVPFLLAS